MNWEREALKEIIGLLVRQNQDYVKKVCALDFLGIDLKWDNECFEIIEYMTPNWENICKPPSDVSYNEKYVNMVYTEIEKEYMRKDELLH